MAVAGKDTKGMAKSLAMAPGDDENRILAHVKSWPEKTRDFYHDVRTETKKVTTPSWKEVQATTAVVIITVFYSRAISCGGPGVGERFGPADALAGAPVDRLQKSDGRLQKWVIRY